MGKYNQEDPSNQSVTSSSSTRTTTLAATEYRAMTRKSGRTGSTSTASSSPRDSNNTATTTNNHSSSSSSSALKKANLLSPTSSSSTSNNPVNKSNKRTNSSGGAVLVNGIGDSPSSVTIMTKAPRVNGVTERTSPVKTHHLHQNGTAEGLILENGFHDASTTSSASPSKASGSVAMRGKREIVGEDGGDAVEKVNGEQQLLFSGGITGNNKMGQSSYLSPTKSPNNISGTPLYKVIDKSMSYTKSPQLLSPGGHQQQQARMQSPTTPVRGDGMRSPSITKTPAEEVKSNRRGMGQLSPVTSPLKSPGLLGGSSAGCSSSGGLKGGKRTFKLRKTELLLLNDEAENFMFPKAKDEDFDSDSSDVIIIVKGKKQKKQKQDGSNVDDQTMALIKREMGEEEEEEHGGDQEVDEPELEQVEDVEPIVKAVNLLPLKKRYGASKAALKLEKTNKQIPILTPLKKQRTTKKGVKVKVEVVKKEVGEEEPEVIPVAPVGKKKAARTKKGKNTPSIPPIAVVETKKAVILELPAKRRKGVKKETAKARIKREKLEHELSLIIKTEPEEEQVDFDEETYSNLTRLMEAEEVTRYRFAFERVPSMEPWFAAFHRQDEGEERIFEYYGSTKYKKLPYEMGQLPPLPENCCALSHLRGTPTKSPRKARGAIAATSSLAGGVNSEEGVAKPTRLFSSARISMKRNKKLQEMQKTDPVQESKAKGKGKQQRQQQLQELLPVQLPRRRGRPSLVSRMVQEEIQQQQQQRQEGEGDEDEEPQLELSAKQKAAVTKNIVERKRKLLAELEHPRKSPREHASTLAILSCLLQQRQLNSEKKCGKDNNANGSEEEMSSRNSESASERRDSNCFEREDDEDGEGIETEGEEQKTKNLVGLDETAEQEDDDDVSGDGSRILAATTVITTTTDGDTTEGEQGPLKRKRKSSAAAIIPPEIEILIPKTPPTVDLLKRSNSSMSSGHKKRRKHHWRARDSINAQELNREIELLLTDPLNASAESIDSKLLDKSDDFLLPFHECPNFSELVLTVDGDDYKQGYVRKSFAPKKSAKAAAAAAGRNNILQLDYQLRSNKKRKNRTGWPTNKRRISAAAKKESQNKSRSVSCDAKNALAEVGEEEGEEEDDEEEGEQEIIVPDSCGNKRGKLTIITESTTSNGETLKEDPLQRSPILRKLLSPQWKTQQELMPSPGRGGGGMLLRGTSSSPNCLERGRQTPVRRGKNIRSPICELLMDCDSVSSISVMVSDDPDGQLLSSDNTTTGAVTSAQSPSAARLLKQTTLGRFFRRRTAEEKEKENSLIEEEEEEQEVDPEDEEMDVEPENEIVEEEEEENDPLALVEDRVVVVDSRNRRSVSKLRNGINMNPIISITKLPTELTKAVAGSGGSVGAKSKRKGSTRVNAAIRSKRRKRKIV